MPLVILACRVMQSLMEPHLREQIIPTTYMDYGLHRTPKKMAGCPPGTNRCAWRALPDYYWLWVVRQWSRRSPGAAAYPNRSADG